MDYKKEFERVVNAIKDYKVKYNLSPDSDLGRNMQMGIDLDAIIEPYRAGNKVDRIRKAIYDIVYCECEPDLTFEKYGLKFGDINEFINKKDGWQYKRVYRPMPGSAIEDVAIKAVELAKDCGESFLLAFNGVYILVNQERTAKDICEKYYRCIGTK